MVLVDSTFRRRALQCGLLNGCVFVGSVVLFERIMKPWFSSLSPWPWLVEAVSTFYYLLLIVPAYVLSFIVNARWYSELASAVFRRRSEETKQQRPSSKVAGSAADVGTLVQQFGAQFAETTYSNLLYFALSLQCTLAGKLPSPFHVPVQFLCICWTYSFYCFDYHWTYMGKSVSDRMRVFSEDWAFFLGFGTPFALSTYWLSFFVSYGMFAVLYPFFISLAVLARPASVQKGRLGQAPIFALPSRIVALIVHFLNRRRVRNSNKK